MKKVIGSYEEIADNYCQVVDNKPFHTLYERPNLIKMIPNDLNGKTIVDLGCGTGWYAFRMLELGAKEVIAIDSSQKMIDVTLEKSPNESIKGFCHDLNYKMDFIEDSTIDFIIAPLVIHYLEDWQEFFKEQYRILRDGGLMYFTTHNPYMDIELFNLKNYYETQVITTTWPHVGEVQFYHHTLEALFAAINNAKLTVELLNEPQPMTELKGVEPQLYELLTTKPGLLFVSVRK